MSKENNLTDFLTEIANTIRTNDKTTDKINPQDFSSKISKTVGSEVAKKSSTDLSYSNYTFNVPSGYYSTNATYSVPNSTYSVSVNAPCSLSSWGHQEDYSKDIPSSKLYKKVSIRVTTPSIAESILTYYKGDLVATLYNDDTETYTTLNANTLYLFNWCVMNPYHIDCSEINIKFSNQAISFNCNELLTGEDGTCSIEDETNIYFLVYFDSTSNYLRVRYVDDDQLNNLECFKLIENSSYSYTNVVLTGGGAGSGDSSDTTLYIYKCNLV